MDNFYNLISFNVEQFEEPITINFSQPDDYKKYFFETLLTYYFKEFYVRNRNLIIEKRKIYDLLEFANQFSIIKNSN